MIKKVIYILISGCMTLSVAMADQLPSSQVLLSSDQMDQVTAGLSANVGVGALASSNYLALAKVDAVSTALKTSGGGGVAIGAGQALAGAAGSGAATGTGVTSATDLSGPNTYSQQHNVYMAGQLGQINTSAIIAVNMPSINPF